MTAHIKEADYREIRNAAKDSPLSNNSPSKPSSEEQRHSDEEKILPKMGGGKPYPPMAGDPIDYMVLFDGADDSTNPQSFSSKKKTILIFVIICTCFTSTFGSSALSGATLEILEKYHVSLDIATLCTALFILGYASGPVLWGPLSDVYGRKFILIASAFIYLTLNFAAATAENIQTIIICRFFSGFASAAPMVICPAIIAEVSNTSNRGNIITLFVMVLVVGPLLAPIVNGFIVMNNSLSWRWCFYLVGILSSVALVLLVIFYPETHSGVILSRKAQVLRKKTGNWSIFAGHENSSFLFHDILTKSVTLPIRMLFLEPILLSVTLYNSFIFGLLYLLLTATPIIFGSTGYGFSQGVSLLPLIAIILGVEVGGITNLYFDKRYLRIIKKKGKLVPEERLLPMMIGAVAFPCGLFWVAWTGQYPHKVHWIVPTIGTFFIGFGLMCIFLPSFSYLVECYLPYVPSAVAGNTIVRYFFGAIFPLFARQMFERLKVNWGGSLLGFISVLLLPIPFLFYKYGQLLRDKSRYALKN